MIKDFANEYTKFPADWETASVNNILSISTILRQFADTGFLGRDIENFKRYLAIPDSYGAKVGKIINPALED